MIDDERSVTADMGQRPDENSEDTQVNSRTPPRSSKKENKANLGAALRAIYSQTVDEQVPSEMLDLLKRLD